VEGGRERGSGRQVTAYEPWMRVGKTLERAAEKREKEEGEERRMIRPAKATAHRLVSDS